MSVEKAYDPTKVIADFGGQITGIAKGVFIKVTRNEDSAKLDMGGDGEGVLIRNKNRSGRITITLQQDSESNDVLSAKANLFESGGGGVDPFLLKDLRGATLVHAEHAWIVKPPDTEFASDAASSREWVLETDNLEIFVGGVA